MEVAGSDMRELHYLYSPYGLIGVMIKQETTENIYYAETDQLGSIISMLNSDGSYAEKYLYDTWGRRRNPDSWSYDSIPALSLIDRGFTGHERLDEFGLINMNGRVYDPLLGMFLSPDNYVQNPDLTQNFNRYGYCLNNPLKYTDPSGMLMAPADFGREIDAYQNWLCDVAATWHYGGGGGSGGGGGGHTYHYGTLGSGYYDTGDYTYNTSDVMGSLWNATPVDNKFHTYTNINGDWYHTSRTFITVILGDALDQNLTASLLGVGSGPPTVGPGGKPSLLARIIPDKISISIELKVAVIKGIGQNIEFNWITRGKDASIFPYVTNTLTNRNGFEGDAGISFNAAWYLGNPNEIRKGFIYGPSFDIDGGYFPYGGTFFIGYDDKGHPLWIGGGSGVGGTLGGSWGNGTTKPGL